MVKKLVMVKNEKMKRKYKVDVLHIKKKPYIQRNPTFPNCGNAVSR